MIESLICDFFVFLDMIKYTEISNLERFFVALLVTGFMIWFGGTIIRTALSYDLFDTGTISIRQDLRQDQGTVGYNIYLFAQASLYTNIAYAISFISLIFLTIRFRKVLKYQGWLFMSIVLFFLNLPIEIYYIYLDYALSVEIFFNNEFVYYTSPIFRKLFLVRFENIVLSILKGISFMSAITIIILCVWQPLRKEYREELGS
ncbi:MAG: hypothetical protein CVV22_00550 [Ignavibacteriae bacterium HGW-Ignavibacteriae-1]|nr:MAG: hypothetical protein CVV22_00550 [Ignavibacteriae bacterium HGW-Ignavibacteriae-1]